MWLGTIVLVTAASAQEIKGGAKAAYADAVDALIVQGTIVEPALPWGLATVVLNGLADLADGDRLVVTVEESDEGLPSLSSVELDPGADFDGDGDVDGRDFLRWQRGGSPNPLDAGDLAIWQDQYGTRWNATINEETWLGAAVPEVDDRVLLAPPKDLEFFGFEIEQDGKVRGALLWEVRTTQNGTEVVAHLWATAALEPLLEAGDRLDYTYLALGDSVPAFYDDVVLTLDSDPIATYEQTTETVLKIAQAK